MRKAEKRRIGREKQEQNLRESRESGLNMQNEDHTRQLETKREANTNRTGQLTPGTSKKALEKATRAADRLAEKALEAGLRKAIYTGEDGRYEDNYVILEELGVSKHPELKKCESYGCRYVTEEEHAMHCPGNVSFRDVPYVKGYTHEEMDQQAEAESIDLARINAIYGTGI